MEWMPGIGMDEVGRGAWAGPFVACAVWVWDDDRRVRGVRDSKMLSAQRREEIALVLQKRHTFGLGIVSVEELDALGMTKAQTLAFERALAALTPTLSQRERVTIDGLPIRSHPEWTGMIDGDQKVYSIAAASIIAKVARDAMMRELHGADGRYRFDLHKGYGTALHQKMIDQYGPSVHHRRLFEPVRKMLYSEK